jgi:hypothetical protein
VAAAGPILYASSALFTCTERGSSSENTATDFIPSSLQARTTLRAISPLFAIRILLIDLVVIMHLYRFIFPCFFHGCVSLLVENVSSARIIIGLVSIGSITKSIIPFSAAI